MNAIPGYPGYYASEDGRIFSLRTGSFQVLSPRYHKGYLHVNIRTGIGRYSLQTKPIHQLVLLAYRGPKTEQQVSRHLNGDSLDNRLSNLLYGSVSENIQDSIRHGTAVCLRVGDNSAASKLMSEDVFMIHSLANLGFNQNRIARRFGINQKHVSSIKLKQTWKHLWKPGGDEIPNSNDFKTVCAVLRRKTRIRILFLGADL